MARPFAVIGGSMFFILALLFFLPEAAVFAALALCGLGLVAALLLHKKGTPATVPTAFGAALLACLLLLLQLTQVYYPTRQAVGEDLEIRATILSNAEAKYGRYYYQVKSITVGGEASALRMRLSCRYPLYAQPYDEVQFTGTIFTLGQEDPEQTANHKAKGVYLGCYAQNWGEDPIEVLETHALHPMKAVLLLRQYLLDSLQRLYPDHVAALYRGMLLGDDAGIPWAVRGDFSRTGIAHLFSVSGLHMSLLTWSLFRALMALKLRRRSAAVGSSLFVLLLMALTGFHAACVRAGITMLVLMMGELVFRKADSLNSLGLAATILLLISPLSAGQVGMQLSFAATLGILLFQRRLAAPLRAKARNLPKLQANALRSVNDSLCVSAAATALTLPVQLMRLPGGASLLSLPANLIFVPLSSLGMVVAALSVFAAPLRYLASPLGKLLLWGTHWMSALPSPMLRGSGTALYLTFACCALIAAAALLARYCGKPMRLRVTALLLCIPIALGCALPALFRRGTNVQQLDDTTYLIHQGGHTALLGTGDPKNALQALGIYQLDVLILPGNDEAAALRRTVPTERIIAETGTFTLWQDAYGALVFQEDGSSRCSLQLDGKLYDVTYSSDGTSQWKEAAE